MIPEPVPDRCYDWRMAKTKTAQPAPSIRQTLTSDWGQRLIAFAILAATIGLMLSVIWPSLTAPGYLSAWDAGGHLLKARFFAEQLLPNGHLSGWFPTWHGGFDIFQFYPPLLYYILGPLTRLMDPELALRLVMAGLWVGLVPVTYYFVRSFELPRPIAAAGTSLLLALNASFGIGLGALYGVGLLPNGLGAIMAIWTLGRLRRDLADPTRSPRQLLLTGLLFGALILSHTFSAYWFGLASLILLASEVIGRHREVGWAICRYLTMLGIGLVVSAYWWVPLAMGIDQMGPTGALQKSSSWHILTDLLFAKDSGGWVPALLALGGLICLGWKGRYRTLVFLGGTLAVTLLLSINAINGILPFSSVIASSQFVRFHAFAAWLILVLAIFGLAGFWELLKRIRLPFVPVTVFSVSLLLTFALVVWPTLQIKRGFINVVDNTATSELPATADYFRQHLAPGDFILSEFNWESRFYFGSPHFMNQRLPSLVDNVWDMDGNFPEGTLGASKPVLMASTLEQTAYLSTQEDYLRARGVRYIVTTNPATQSRLAGLPWLNQAYTGRVIAVFELRDFNTPFGLPAAVGTRLTEASYHAPNSYDLRFAQPVSLPAGSTLALSYHPWLKVEADGKRVQTKSANDSQLMLIDRIDNARLITITYAPPLSAKLPAVVSLIALILVVLGLVRPDFLDFLRSRARGRRSGRRSLSAPPRR